MQFDYMEPRDDEKVKSQPVAAGFGPHGTLATDAQRAWCA